MKKQSGIGNVFNLIVVAILAIGILSVVKVAQRRQDLNAKAAPVDITPSPSGLYPGEVTVEATISPQ